MEDNKNIWLEFLRTDSVKWIIGAGLIVVLFYFFKWQLSDFKSERKIARIKDTDLIPVK